MPEKIDFKPEIRLMDEEVVQDPESLLLILSDLLEKDRVMSRVLALVGVLLMHHLGELDKPSDEIYQGTLESLGEWLMAFQENMKYEQQADLLRDLLESKE